MQLIKRLAQKRLVEILKDTRVVLVVGPRQAGKTTLIREQLSQDDREFISLDTNTIRQAALNDPHGLLLDKEYMTIDEIQRAPELLLAIKESVDIDKRPGRFLLSGSADVMTLPRVADSLAGRMETLHLLPLSQAEILGTQGTFLREVFNGKSPQLSPSKSTSNHSFKIGKDLVSAVLAGGYPEAIARDNERRRDWYMAYIDSLISRDVKDIAQVDNIDRMQNLLRVLAEFSGQLINYTEIGRRLELSAPTVRKYNEYFEQLFIVRKLQPWFSSKLNRLIRTPKIHFLDSGLLAALKGLSADEIGYDKTAFGHVLETFVLSELLKLSTVTPYKYRFYHLRDKDSNEVDIVIEDDMGNVVGIEVKASSTVRTTDFNGLRKLQEACGKKFVMGIVLYDHEQTVGFGYRMYAVPISALWV